MNYKYVMKDKDGKVVKEGTCDYTEKAFVAMDAKMEGFTVEFTEVKPTKK